MEFIIKHSKNYRERKGEIKYIILHCSAFAPQKQIELLDYYDLSVHYIIGRDGMVIENLLPSKVAYHAGVSSWLGSKEKSLNEYSIGIELEAPTLGQNKKDYTSIQIESLCNLLKILKNKYNIKPENILGHNDISPELKPDPGKGFPWKRLAKEGYGIWYDLRSLSKTIDEKELLENIGYNTNNIYASRIAFCRHFVSDDAGQYVEVSKLVDYPFIAKFMPKNYERYLKILRATSLSFDKYRQK